MYGEEVDCTGLLKLLYEIFCQSHWSSGKVRICLDWLLATPTEDFDGSLLCLPLHPGLIFLGGIPSKYLPSLEPYTHWLTYTGKNRHNHTLPQLCLCAIAMSSASCDHGEKIFSCMLLPCDQPPWPREGTVYINTSSTYCTIQMVLQLCGGRQWIHCVCAPHMFSQCTDGLAVQDFSLSGIWCSRIIRILTWIQERQYCMFYYPLFLSLISPHMIYQGTDDEK